MMEVEYHICNMTMTGLLMTPVVAVVTLDGVEVGAVVEGVVVGAQEAEVLVKLAISLNPYLMIVKCHNPTLCLLSMTCKVGTVHLEKGPEALPDTWLLIDSCSTIDIISSPGLLHRIHKEISDTHPPFTPIHLPMGWIVIWRACMGGPES